MRSFARDLKERRLKKMKINVRVCDFYRVRWWKQFAYSAGASFCKRLGETLHKKFASIKQEASDRCPKDLGAIVKTSEVIYHHEVTNQVLWHRF